MQNIVYLVEGYGFVGFGSVERRCARKKTRTDGYFIEAHYNTVFKMCHFVLSDRCHVNVTRRISGVWSYDRINDVLAALRDLRFVWRPETWPDEWLKDMIRQHLRRLTCYLLFIIKHA